MRSRWARCVLAQAMNKVRLTRWKSPKTVAALEIRPPEPAVTIFEMKRSRGASEQSQPLASKGDHITELLPDQIGIFEVVMLADQFVPSLHLGSINQASDFQFIQHRLLLVRWQAK